MVSMPVSSPTPYPELNAVLAELTASVQSVLGDDFVSICLQGSFAVGDFDAHSDVDFVVIIRQELSPAQVQTLDAMHRRIYALPSPWAQHLEGSYFPRDTLRSYTNSGSDLWYLDNGSQTLARDHHDNSRLVRQVMRTRGICLAGTGPVELIDPIPVDELRGEMLTKSRAWWQRVQENPQSINSHFYQTFAVLHFCRMLHDLHTGEPGSKRKGAEWVQSRYPQWSGLIDRTWAGRPIPEQPVRRPADPADLQLTMEFIPFILHEAEAFAVVTGLNPTP